MARDASRVRLGAASFAIAGVLFLLYPAIRPFSDETSLQGAAAFASTAWILAHMLAMVGFTLVMLGLLGLYLAFRATAVEGIAFWALAVGLLSIGLLLPFYGGEAFGLHAIGEEALRQRSLALVGLAGEGAGQAAEGSGAGDGHRYRGWYPADKPVVEKDSPAADLADVDQPAGVLILSPTPTEPEVTDVTAASTAGVLIRDHHGIGAW